MAKEKLHHLQELVKVVQHGGGPSLPLDELQALNLTLSDTQEDGDEEGEEEDSSAYGESEEEATEEGETEVNQTLNHIRDFKGTSIL